MNELARDEIEQKTNIESFMRMMNLIPALLGYWDSQQRNIYANAVYAEYFGKTPSEILGLSMQELLGERLFELNKPHVIKVLEGEPQTFERELVTVKGERKYLLANYIPDNVDGSVQGFFVIVTDISSIKVLEIKRRELELNLVNASRVASLGQIAGGISHEINNPLTIVKGKLYFLKRELKKASPNADFCLKTVETLDSTVDRIVKIISSLQTFAGDSTHESFSFRGILSIVEDTIHFSNERYKNHKIEFRMDSFKEDIAVECRPKQISQVLFNLLANAFSAVEAMPEPWVKIELKDLGSKIEISVTDSGKGIPVDLEEKIFEPFFTTNTVGKGAGLGLSLCKGLIEGHKGKLWVDQTCSNTKFSILLPKNQSLVEALDNDGGLTKSKTKNTSNLYGKTVLVVEDEPLVREVLCDYLHALGCKGIQAANGLGAYDLAIKHQVDIVLSDVRMPGQSGLKLLSELRANHPTKPAVVLLSEYDDLTEEAAREQGAQALIAKPIHPEDLKKILESL